MKCKEHPDIEMIDYPLMPFMTAHFCPICHADILKLKGISSNSQEK